MPPKHSEQDANAYSPNPVWIPGLAVFFFLLLLFISEDGVTRYILSALVLERIDWEAWCISGVVVALFFALQAALLRLRRFRWCAWLPMGLFALGIGYSELLWAQGGWNRLGGGLIWLAAVLPYLGAFLAAVFLPLRRQKKSVRLFVAALLLVAVAVGAWFWPHPIRPNLLEAPPERMLYFNVNEEDQWMEITDPQKYHDTMLWVNVSPRHSAPDWRAAYRGLLVRLDEQHVLMAPCNNHTPYIYRYQGPLERFDGTSPRWVVCGFPALYDNLMAVGNWVED